MKDCSCFGDRCSEHQIENFEKLKEQNKILKEALGKIKMENLDDKTQVRFIESLKKWQSKVCGISFEALKKIEEMK